MNKDTLLTSCAKRIGLTDVQFKILLKYHIDHSKVGYLQNVGLSEDDATQLRSAPTDIINVATPEIQVSQELIWAIEDYTEGKYFIDHEDEPITELGIDIETYSDVDLASSGVYKYAESPNFCILLFAYSINGDSPVRVVDLAMGETLPIEILDALTDPNVLKTAYNASFERICLTNYLHKTDGYLDPKQWDCTMVRAARLALPLSLAQCGAVLGLEQQKMREGHALINYFSKPCKPTKTNGMRRRNLPQHAPEKWELFKRYNKRDVEVEQAIRKKVTRLEVSDTERQLWVLDQRINDRGVQIDLQMAQKASDLDDEYRANLVEEARLITGRENPNSVSQLKDWILSKTGIKFDSLNKESLSDALPRISDPDVRRMLNIRKELGKTSTAKYKAMLACACKDERAHGLFQFYGANRTGRWAGRLLQLQNLPQNHIDDLDYARNLVKNANLDEIAFEYGNVPQLLSELIRTAFIAPNGKTFFVCDFSAIEARVIAWVSGEEWVLDTFRSGGDIYCATASQMFGVPVEKHGINGHLRQKGKIATLACGYGGGVGALEKMGGAKMGLTEQEEQEIIDHWREANPHTVRLWKHVETAARMALKGEALPIEKGITFEYKWGGLCVTLPSKRQLFYPRMGINPDNNRLEYEGMNQEKRIWQRIETYGGKMTENLIQAIARDCLGETMLRLERKGGFDIVFHIHDETVIEVDPKIHTLQEVEEVFCQEIPWAKGLPLKGAGYVTPYYLKD